VGDNAAAPSFAAVVDFDPNATDEARMDQRIVEKFLTNGLPEDLAAFVSDYINSIRVQAERSVTFRQYIVLNIQFTVNAFLEKFGYSKEIINFSQTTGRQLQTFMSTVESIERYVRDLLAHALALRDMAVTSRYSTKLKKAVDYMQNNYHDPEISLNTVARVAFVSPTHFSTLFSQQMGKTFVEYLTELRMDKAKELLRCTDAGSSEIAYQVGYSDPHYFSFIFKKVNGCSPRDYRLGRKSS
jgi:two-component system response regulator YesN